MTSRKKCPWCGCLVRRWWFHWCQKYLDAHPPDSIEWRKELVWIEVTDPATGLDYETQVVREVPYRVPAAAGKGE